MASGSRQSSEQGDSSLPHSQSLCSLFGAVRLVIAAAARSITVGVRETLGSRCSCRWSGCKWKVVLALQDLSMTHGC